MRGDFTRLTFRPDRHYSSVRLQQGRVGLDADWNEQNDIEAYHRETALRDVVGPTGAPHDAPDAFLHFQVRPDGTDLLIAPGRIYVDGVLCENEAVVRATEQPHLPPDAPVVRRMDESVDPLPAGEGTYVVYLDVWQRDISPIEDPSIREQALGGPDTAIRTQTVWQVGLLEVQESDPTCSSDIAAWNDLVAGGEGRLSARAQPGEATEDPCIVPPGGGFRRLENQLYRVEIHDPGPLGTATFKWSRENGSIVTRWLRKDGNDLTVESAGHDATLGFAAGDWVELTDDDRELRGDRGLLVRLANVEGQVLTIAPDSPPFAFTDFGGNPKLRRWDLPEAGLATVERPAANDGYLALEDGVEVRFALPEANGNGVPPVPFRTGDYWLIPARTLTADVEWPRSNGQPVDEPPRGIRHHFCRLAIVRAAADGTLNVVSDCRPLFPGVTDLTGFFYVGGDGQEALPGAVLRHPLQVGVANGRWPVAGARIRFAVTRGGGTLEPPDVANPQETIAVTDASGVASCRWRIGATADEASDVQQVTATLLDDLNGTRHLPVRFGANPSVARLVAYAPGGSCTDLVGIATVQDAIDELCKSGENVEGVHVMDVLLRSTDRPLPNDGNVPAPLLVDGIHVVCDRGVSEEIREKPVGAVTVDLPFPFSASDRETWGDSVIGFQTITLAGSLRAEADRIIWEPTARTADWLSNQLFGERLLQTFAEAEITAALLTRLTLKGNFIWGAEDKALYLDGESFGVPTGSEVALDLPSGDRRRGGDFETWFWLVQEEPGLQSVALAAGSVTGGNPLPGTVTLSARAEAGTGTTVTLTSDNPAATVPGSVVVPPGQLSANFEIATQRVAADQPITITARLVTPQGETQERTAAFTLRAPRLLSVTFATPTTGAQTAGGTVTLDGGAPTAGIDVALTSSSTQVATVPASVRVLANQLSATFTATVQAPGQTTITGTLLDSTRVATLRALPKLRELVLDAGAVVRGRSLGGRVRLTQAVPFPVTVNLQSGNPAIAAVPGALTIDANTLDGVLTVSAPGPVGLATIVASLPGSDSRSDQLQVLPRLQSFAVQPNDVPGGATAVATVTLESVAPFAILVSLESSNAAVAAPPASVGIAANQRTGTSNPIDTADVFTTRTVNIRAFYGDVPAPSAAGESQLTAALTVRRVGKPIFKNEKLEFEGEFDPVIVGPSGPIITGPIVAGPIITGPFGLVAPSIEAAAEAEPAAGRAFIQERPAVGPPADEQPPEPTETVEAVEPVSEEPSLTRRRPSRRRTRPAPDAQPEPPAPDEQPPVPEERPRARRRGARQSEPPVTAEQPEQPVAAEQTAEPRPRRRRSSRSEPAAAADESAQPPSEEPASPPEEPPRARRRRQSSRRSR